MAERKRILVISVTEAPADGLFAEGRADWDLIRVPTLREALERIQAERFDAIVAPTANPRVLRRLNSLLQADSILDVMGEGVAVVTPDRKIAWANPRFAQWAGGRADGKDFFEALGSPDKLGPEASAFYNALPDHTSQARFQAGARHFDMRVAPLLDAAGHVSQHIAMLRNVTPEVQQQQKLDALHHAANELAAITPDQLADMDIEERVEVLKQNIRRLTHDLLHYDVIEIRLLDHASGRLEPLLSDGMTPEAAQRILYAREEGNGVTGYVAATGKSYLCVDTANDPHYIEGAKGAKSSLTVALSWGDRVIGTFNVESPHPGGFGPQDVQFTEIFCRELAAALHTLELLLIEKRTTAEQSIEAVNRAVVIPVDEILNEATAILDRWIGHEPEMAEKLKKILSSARSIKQSIQKVGEDMTPAAKSLSSPGFETPSRLKGQRVLVVDNDERVRRSAHSLLGRWGCIVETARDGQEALTMARLSAYDAMLADIRLPDLSGFDVYRALREAQPNARVILMTGFGYDSSHSIVKARAEGLRHVLYKPFRVEQMLEALQSRDQEPAPVPAAATKA
ncbi:MAG: response regulator [Gemmataceae bacterium]